MFPRSVSRPSKLHRQGVTPDLLFCLHQWTRVQTLERQARHLILCITMNTRHKDMRVFSFVEWLIFLDIKEFSESYYRLNPFSLPFAYAFFSIISLIERSATPFFFRKKIIMGPEGDLHQSNETCLEKEFGPLVKVFLCWRVHSGNWKPERRGTSESHDPGPAHGDTNPCVASHTVNHVQASGLNVVFCGVVVKHWAGVSAPDA